MLSYVLERMLSKSSTGWNPPRTDFYWLLQWWWSSSRFHEHEKRGKDIRENFNSYLAFLYSFTIVWTVSERKKIPTTSDSFRCEHYIERRRKSSRKNSSVNRQLYNTVTDSFLYNKYRTRPLGAGGMWLTTVDVIQENYSNRGMIFRTNQPDITISY